MNNYRELKKTCELNSSLMERVVNEFLVGYAAGHRNTEKELKRQFDRYRHVTRLFDPGNLEMMKVQYLMHRVFREDGLIGRLMKLPALERFRGEERRFLDQQAEVPWRFSFSEVLEAPEKEFFRMRDILTGKGYLLFSPGMEQIRASASPLLFFNLIWYNGSCWQCYGPIGAYSSFQPGDIWFYATEVNPEIEMEEEADADIQRDPLPYIMLHSGAAYPLSFHKKDQVVYAMAEYDLDSVDTASIREKFKSEYDSGVYRFSLKNWGEHPHFAHAYFDENERLILFTAMTDRGFVKLVEEFNRFGYRFETAPFLRVNIQMVVTAGKILQRDIVLNEYEELFQEETDPEDQKMVDDLNAFISLVLPDINEGRIPDIEAAAKKAGISIETARDLMNQIQEKRDEIPATDDGGAPGKQPPGGKRKPGDERKPGGKRQPGRDPQPDRDPGPGRTARFSTLYSLAEEIRKEEPWTYLEEADLFGVKIPGTDRIYYLSVMGSGGEYTALSAYRGYSGLGQFLDLQSRPGPRIMERILTIPHLMVSFNDREGVDEENLEAIKTTGLKFRGKGRWPALKKIVPGYIPEFPDEEGLSDLEVLLEQALEVFRQAGEDEDYLGEDPFEDNKFLVRTPSGKPDRLEWSDRFEPFDPEKGTISYRMSYHRDSCSRLSRLSVSPVTLQADLVMIPSPVAGKDGKGIFPFGLLLVDKESGIISGMEMLIPEPDLKAMYESVPQKILDILAKTGFRPEMIEIRSQLLHGLVEGALKAAWCRSILVDELPRLDEAADSLIGGRSK